MLRFYDSFTLEKRSSGGFEAPVKHKGRIYALESQRVSTEGVVGLMETHQLMAPVDCPLSIDDRVTIRGTVFYVGQTPEVLTVKGRDHHKRVQLNRTA